ncbi:MAG TPA: ATP-binding protein [Chloroflexota bacterium]|nr:ATP-binding protein [Chloroflexota bacterium]
MAAVDRNESSSDGRSMSPHEANILAVEGTTPAEADALCLELAAARQEIERLRSDLLSTVSHELRTPLTLIRTSVGLLLDTEPDPAMRERLLRNIKQSADRMQALVTDMLDLVRLRNGRAELAIELLDVGELVESAASLMKPLLDEKEQGLELDMPLVAPRVMGDQRRLEQVLLNLLSNANKFAPQAATVRISVSEDAESVMLSVADSGPGITPAGQERLFDQFYTSRTSSPSHNIGVGLGLPIAKGIVEAHGGRIWVESEMEKGSIFRFSIPKDGPGRGVAE